MVTLEIQPHLSCRSGLLEAPERGASALEEKLFEFLGILLTNTMNRDSGEATVATGP